MVDEIKNLTLEEFRELSSDLQKILNKWKERGFAPLVTGSGMTQFIANKIINGVFEDCSDISQIIDEVEREALNISCMLHQILDLKLQDSLQSGSESKN